VSKKKRCLKGHKEGYEEGYNEGHEEGEMDTFFEAKV